ncbi:hypothetical protein LJR267_000305 [Paraburkholderia hospita]|jgi:hypothetical protein
MKNANHRSLRYQVEKWLAPASTSLVHVTEFGRTRSGRTRYVCVETSTPAGLRVLFFFRHDNGTWHVFPPAVDRQKSTTEPLGREMLDFVLHTSAFR